MPRTAKPFALLMAFALLVPACGPKSDSSGEGGAAGTGADIARIVVVDQETCCACTRERIDKTGASLEAALAGSTIPVERIHMDTEPERTEEMVAKRAIMVLPAIYFMSGEGEVVRFLQGELSEEQIRVALGKTG